MLSELFHVRYFLIIFLVLSHVFIAYRFLLPRHVKQKEEDIAICVCQFDANDPDSACGERCLNVLTSTECTPGCCPCGVYCKNQVSEPYVLR